MFKNREEAAEKLAAKLIAYKNNSDVVVYALPRGGVVLGRIVADALNTPLDLVITRKIANKFSPEYAVGAVAEDGDIIYDPMEISSLDEAWIKDEIIAQKAEAKRRREKYLAGKTPMSAKNKIALIIDDGIATGLTIKCAIGEIKHQNPKKIVVATGVIPAETIPEINKLVNELVYLEAPIYMGSIGEFYAEFPQVEDEEVIKLMSSKQK